MFLNYLLINIYIAPHMYYCNIKEGNGESKMNLKVNI